MLPYEMKYYNRPKPKNDRRNDMKSGIELIANERLRQVKEEGWTPEHDDQHTDGELAEAASVYAADATSIDLSRYDDALHFTSPMSGDPETRVLVHKKHRWPWSKKWYKPTPDDRIRELSKAGALIAAEIDRLQREKEAQS